METFDFPYFTYATEYPDSGFRMQLGNSYQYSAAPTSPDQRLVRLYFDTMVNYPCTVFKQPLSPTALAVGDLWIHTGSLPNKPYRWNGTTWALSTTSVNLNIMKQPEINAGRLDSFYNTHKLHKKFIFPHPIYGNMAVRFNKPLVLPKGIKDGGGALEAFELELIEIPGGL